MLRTIFVLAIAAGLGFRALQATFFALILYLWVAYFRPEEWVWGGIVTTLNLSWWAGVLLVGRAVFAGEVVSPDRRTGLLLLVLAQCLLSTIFSVDVAHSWTYFQAFAKSIVVTYLLATLVNDPWRFRVALVTIALSLGFEATKQGWAQLVLNPGGKNFNPIPFLGDENGVAIGMLMLVPMLAVLGQTTSRTWERLVYRFMVIGVLYRGIITYSRGGFVACLALGGIYLVRSPNRIRSLLGIAIAGMIILPVLPEAFWERMGTITAEEDERDRSAQGRLHYWSVAFEMIQDRPLLGVGHNAYNRAYDDYDFLRGAFGTERSVHSAWLGTAAELGIPGLILVGAVFATAFARCRRVRRLARSDPRLEELGRYALAIEASLVPALVGGIFVIFQYTEILWHIFGLSIALETVALRVASSAAPANEERGNAPATRDWWRHDEDAA